MSTDKRTAIRPSGQIIESLWNDEGCGWSVRLDDGKWWNVVLEWSTDQLYLRDSDWATLTWEFYDESLDVALADAARWCEQLAPWRRCSACDGRGEWNGNRCDGCGGSGLENGSPADSGS